MIRHTKLHQPIVPFAFSQRSIALSEVVREEVSEPFAVVKKKEREVSFGLPS